MCGIAGFWCKDGGRLENEHTLAAMTDTLAHRGPDGGQVVLLDAVGLGHRRLSIIAPDASADQPMRRGPLTIVYNGELYNYREEKARLEAKGYSFLTKSDTEVLLALFEEQGPDCFRRLDGIFALAIYDERTRRLTCARDHFGVKPFLYAQTKQGFLFASELKSLLASGLIGRQIDINALSLLLQAGSVPQPYTMVAGVRSLLPGHYMVCDDGGIEITRYYTLQKAAVTYRTDEQWKKAIEAALLKAVDDQMVADVPIGAFLSGGVDSGLIAALMKKTGAQVKTYSVGFEHSDASGQYDETGEAAEMAAALGTEHQTFTVSDAEAGGALLPLIRGLDHPGIDGINSYFVSQATARHVRVALSGTGADEIFGGYAWFRDMKAYEEAGIWRRLKHLAKGEDYVTYYKSLHRVFPRDVARRLLGQRFSPASYPLSPELSGAQGTARVSDLVIHGFLQNQLLPDIDTASMAHGLEVRVPYLSVPLVELVLAAPDHLKLGVAAGGETYADAGTKKILVDIARQYLPSGFDRRPKRGFAMPMARWLQTIWGEAVDDTLSAETIRKRGLFDPVAVQNIRGGAAPWTQTWLLMAVELWCRTVLDAG